MGRHLRCRHFDAISRSLDDAAFCFFGFLKIKEYIQIIMNLIDL